MELNNGRKVDLKPEPIPMKRKVSFRDEKEEKPIADIHYVPSNKSAPEASRSSCLNCQIF